MSTINSYTTVHCPYEEVPSGLKAALGGEIATIPLRFPVGDIHVEKDVRITLRPKPDYPGYKVLDISWEPIGGLYPSFHGTLSVEDEGAGWSRVDLDGTYKPALSFVGAAFDATVGHRIAEATAAELLRYFKEMLEGRVAAR
jgi:hypothetical protein